MGVQQGPTQADEPSRAVALGVEGRVPEGRPRPEAGRDLQGPLLARSPGRSLTLAEPVDGPQGLLCHVGRATMQAWAPRGDPTLELSSCDQGRRSVMGHPS